MPGSPSLLEAAGLLALQTRDGLAFRPVAEVALAMEEHQGRLTIVLADGMVAHRPGPLESLPVPGLVPLDAGTLAAPRHGSKRGHQLRFPGGWEFPARALPRARPRLPATASPTARVGRTEFDLSLLRSFEAEGVGYRIRLEGGATYFIRYRSAQQFVKSLGLPALDHLEPMSEVHRAMSRRGLRDFPCLLLTASTSRLKSWFGSDERLCIANLIWEAARRRARGLPLDYGEEHRGFYYRPVLAVLHRLGLVRPSPTAELRPDDELPPLEPHLEAFVGALDPLLWGVGDPHYLLYSDILSDMIGRDRLLTLEDLGFEDQNAHLRTIGTQRPDWVVVAEKVSLLHDARTLGERFGVSTIVLGGMARWEATEPLARQLSPVLAGRPVNVVSYGDYDPDGWLIVDTLMRQLARYGVTAQLRGRLVEPRRFSAREIALVAEPIVATGSNRAKLDQWMAQGGGIRGRALRIHADHLRPVKRVIAAFHEETGLREVSP